MKKFLLLILGLSIACGPVIRPEMNGVKGFRDMDLGSSLADFQGLEAAERRETENVALTPYVRKGEDMVLGGAELRQVRYYFFDDKLVETSVLAADPNCEPLSEMFHAKYGESPGMRWNIANEEVQLEWTWMLGVCNIRYTLRSAESDVRKRKEAEEKRLEKEKLERRLDQAGGL